MSSTPPPAAPPRRRLVLPALLLLFSLGAVSFATERARLDAPDRQPSSFMLLLLHITGDTLIALSCLLAGALLLRFWWQVRRLARPGHGWLLGTSGGFLLLLGVQHILSVAVGWGTLSWGEGAMKLLAALAGVAVTLVLPTLFPQLRALLQAAAQQALLLGEQRAALQILEDSLGQHQTDLTHATREIARQRAGRTALINRYRLLARHYPGVVAVFNRDLVYELADGQAAQDLGYDLSQLEGQPFGSFDPSRAAEAADDARAVLAGETRTYRYAHRGQVYQTTMTPMWEGDEIVAGLVVLVNVTEQVQALERLETSERRYRLITEHATDLVQLIDLDREGAPLYTSPSSTRVVAEQPPRLLAPGGGASVLPPERSRAAALWGDLLAGSEAAATLPVAGPAGRTRYLDLSARRLDQDGRRLAVVVGRDITEQRQLQEQFHQAQRLESIGRLAGGIAHDMNNLLSVIMGQGQLALDELTPGTQVYADVRDVLHTARKAAALSRQILAFARQGMIEVQPVDLGLLVQRAASMLERLVGEQIAVSIQAPPSLPVVMADPGQVEQVLANLMVNARDAIMDRHPGGVGGEIAIHIYETIVASGQPGGPRAGRYVALDVRDNGKGMPESIRPHILEPFFTTKPKGKGTGLGLSTSHGIITQHGGALAVESAEDVGTTVTVYLPAERLEDEGGRGEGPGAKDKGQGGKSEGLPRGDETILVVEDEPALRAFATRVLRRLGYTVYEAENGADALAELERLQTQGVTVQLVFTDVIMPRMSGVQLADALSRLAPGLPVLFTSGYADNTITHAGIIEVNSVPFLAKPYLLADLAVKVRKVLEG